MVNFLSEILFFYLAALNNKEGVVWGYPLTPEITRDVLQNILV